MKGNKIRIIGVAIFILTLVLRHYLTNTYDFWYSAAGGIGGILAITGKIKRAR